MFKAHRIASVSAIRGEQRGMLLAQTLSTAPRSFLAITAKAAFDWEIKLDSTRRGRCLLDKVLT